jgi:hypothetical protein
MQPINEALYLTTSPVSYIVRRVLDVLPSLIPILAHVLPRLVVVLTHVLSGLVVVPVGAADLTICK